ncbi:TonB-dependent receptor [Rhodobacteraceae bacterium B1Z28]|uniref:TonB-dependent receptor n=1 Tax=Ruegeria haliotis TaxID=2747601 RepID=A0ABX2PRH4_9RHOB|nr:TonB-dependent receptor [Ruegeria haliotis]NVO56742.1 TonB-dependent receptor [Ruegeria haliotis]
MQMEVGRVAIPGAARCLRYRRTAGAQSFHRLFQQQPVMVFNHGCTYVDTGRLDNPTSPHNLVLWGRYTIPQGRFEGTDLGLGVRAASRFESSSGDGVTISAAGYVVADAMVRYPISDAVSAQLSIENIFDKTYYTRVNQATRGNFYGTPRRFTVALNANF